MAAIRLVPTVQLVKLDVNACERCDFVTENSNEMGEHKKTHQFIDEDQRAFSQKLLRKENLAAMNDSPYFPCKFCEFKSKYLGVVEKHTTRIHQQEVELNKQIRKRHLEQSYDSSTSTPRKQAKLSDDQERNPHTSQMISSIAEPAKEFECVLCSKTFLSKDDLRSHLEQGHATKSEEFQCCFCALIFRKKIVLTLHLKTVHSLDDVTAKNLVVQLTQDNDAATEETSTEIRDSASPRSQDVVEPSQENDSSKIFNTRPGNSTRSGNTDRHVRPRRSLRLEGVKTERPDSDVDRYSDASFHDRGDSDFDTKEEQEESISDSEAKDTSRLDGREELQKKSLKPSKIYQCDDCEQAFPSRRQVKNHKKNDHGVQCEVCNEHFASQREVNRHKKKIHGISEFSTRDSQKSRKKICKICHEVIMGIVRYKEHMNIVHEIVCPELPCSLCDQEFFSVVEYSRHVQKDHGIKRDMKKHPCQICKKSFDRKFSLQRHMKSVHEQQPSKTFACTQCSKNFNGERSLKDHLKFSHGGKISGPEELAANTCPVCQKKIISCSVIHHLRAIHTAEESVICDHCGKIFHSKLYHKNHMRRFDKIRVSGRQVCHLCGVSVADESQLRNHMRYIHNPTWDLICDICSKTFRQKNELNAHVRVAHENIKFECDKCNFTCSTASYLKRHIMYKHEGIEPPKINCPSCTKVFGSKQVLNAHIKKDHDGQIFKCPQCDRNFGVKMSLDRHIKAVHQGLKPHKCPVCNQSFGIKHSMQRHYKSCHEGGAQQPKKESSKIKNFDAKLRF